MNLIPSIHDTPINPIAKTYNQTNTERSPDINIDLYSNGFLDGLTGLNAELPHVKNYWDGYSLGYREYCCGLLGVAIPVEEIS